MAQTAGSVSAISGAEISRATTFTYALPVTGYAFMYMLFTMYYMKFSTDTLLLAPAVVGAIFGLGRLWDAVTDPLAGYLSDITRHPMGRRRSWLLYSAVPIGITFVATFAPPAALGPGALVAWSFVSVFAFFTAITLFVVPHFSLGAELVFDSHSRSRLFGYRFGAEITGWIVGLAAITYLIRSEASGPEATRHLALQISAVAAVAMIAMLVFASLSLSEHREFQGRGGARPVRAFFDVAKNEHARRLLAVTFVEYTGRTVSGVMALYITEYVLKRPSFGPVILLIWLVSSLVSVPVWVRLARTYGRKPIWVGALIASALAYGSMIFLQEGDVWPLILMAVTTGAAAGCGGSLSPSVQSDIIDLDELNTGERKEGTYFACWNFVVKAAGGLTVLLAGALLQWANFVPKADQTPLVKMTMLCFFALFPLGVYLIGAWALAGFTFSESAHAEVRRKLADRKLAGTG